MKKQRQSCYFLMSCKMFIIEIFITSKNSAIYMYIYQVKGFPSITNTDVEDFAWSHWFNGPFLHWLLFGPIGTALGCTMRVKEGAVPNEHGTWLYGRGGWCDGLQVNPWRTDITKQVCPPNIRYSHLNYTNLLARAVLCRYFTLTLVEMNKCHVRCVTLKRQVMILLQSPSAL